MAEPDVCLIMFSIRPGRKGRVVDDVPSARVVEKEVWLVRFRKNVW